MFQQMFSEISSMSRRWVLATTTLVLLFFTQQIDAFIVPNNNLNSILPEQRSSSSSYLSQLQMIPIDALLPSIATTYTSNLIEYPLATKSTTAGLLCSVGDYLAQQRDPTISKVDLNRLLRFTVKGFGGGIIWSFWYDTVDGIVDTLLANAMSISSSSSPPTPDVLLVESSTTFEPYVIPPQIKIIISMILEQFLWCPIVFALWEIPVPSILNGGQVKTIPKDVQDKLPGLLIDNAKVWTPANLLIYSAPLEFRVGLSNIIDIFWQSIVSDMAATCGTTEEVSTPPAAAVADPGVAVVTGFLTTNSQQAKVTSRRMPGLNEVVES